jgi:hypothetical protein
MNIFVLDADPRKAAKMHCDKHVGKMIAESAQMLMTQKSHKGYRNHPCSVWVRTSRENQRWLLELASGLNESYVERYQKTQAHQSFTNVIKDWEIPDDVPDIGLTPFAIAMPEWIPGKTQDGRVITHASPEDAVKLYREYYIHAKTGFATWAHSQAPNWWPHKNSHLARAYCLISHRKQLEKLAK